MGTSSKELFNTLSMVAAQQEGYFSAKQAVLAGYADSVHNYHVRNGDWEKVYRGIYRLQGHPPGEWPELVIWSLWSRGREDEPLGVYSHETALAIHGVSEKTLQLHMSVPSTFRKNCEIPGQLILHKSDLPEGDVDKRGGFWVTTRERTLRDMGVSAGCGGVYSGMSSWCRGKTFEEALRDGED